MSDFNRGYFCAIAALIKIEGLVSATTKELFNAGTNPTCADDEDFEIFVKYGLTFEKNRGKKLRLSTQKVNRNKAFA